MRRANHGTHLQGSSKQENTAPDAQTGKHPTDAREDDQQLGENQQELGVGDDHKTHEMEEGHRGTFP